MNVIWVVLKDPDLEKAEGLETKLPTSMDHQKAREFQKNIYFWFIDYIRAFDCGSQETVKNY